MYKRIILLLLSLVVITSQCFAGDVTFGEAKTAVSGADAQQLEVNDLDGDSKPDLIWRDSSGNLKYILHAGSSIPTEGLVAYYPFNGNANDESGNGNNGTVNGATLTADRNGNANKAYSFDGVDDYINVSDSTHIDMTQAFTIGTWIKRSYQGTTDHPIISKFSTSFDKGYWFGPSQNKLVACLGGVSNVNNCLGSSTSIDTNWHYVTFTFDGTNWRLYLDGKEDGTRSLSMDIASSANIDLAIGKATYLSGRYFNGSIDDIRIYTRALSESEIQALYNEGE
ncbi:LamG domain-containing protein [Deltaproteobacteria bacterium TL4]